jgi:hypothetical protein
VVMRSRDSAPELPIHRTAREQGVASGARCATRSRTSIPTSRRFRRR